MQKLTIPALLMLSLMVLSGCSSTAKPFQPLDLSWCPAPAAPDQSAMSYSSSSLTLLDKVILPSESQSPATQP